MKFRLYMAIFLLFASMVIFTSCAGADKGENGSVVVQKEESLAVDAPSSSPVEASPDVFPDTGVENDSIDSAQEKPNPQPPLPRKKVKIGKVVINAEICDSGYERQAGLSWRRSLGKNDGMLFVFEEKDIYSMWMYGMQFPLDVLWIDDNRVVYIRENVPNPSNPLSTNLPSYTPSRKANYFLEVQAGFVKKHGIRAGDKFVILK